MKWGVWIPPWIAVKSSVCARYDCNELRYEDDDGRVRRYCRSHAEEYEREARETPTRTKLLRLSSSG